MCPQCPQRGLQTWEPHPSPVDGGSSGDSCLEQPGLAAVPSARGDTVLSPSQPFSKSATEHVQSRLSKKQVPPDLFQVGITWDREGVPATCDTQGVSPWRGLGVTGVPEGRRAVTQEEWPPQGVVPGMLGVRGNCWWSPWGGGRLGAEGSREVIGTLDVTLGIPRVGDVGVPRDSGGRSIPRGLEVAVGGCEIPGVEETPRNDGIGVTWVALGTQC